jgi:hypothetical protein
VDAVKIIRRQEQVLQDTDAIVKLIVAGVKCSAIELDAAAGVLEALANMLNTAGAAVGKAIETMRAEAAAKALASG